jgi:hypothetical protein
MTHHITLRVAAVMAILYAIPSLSRADEAETLAKLKVEKAALERHLKEVDTQIDKIQVGQGVNWLGMTLVDPTVELMEEYGLSADYPGPIIVKVQDGSFFHDGSAPTAGCAFWIVEHPVKGFLLNKENKEKAPSSRPRNVRELAESLLLCTVTPEEYQGIWNRTNQAAREYAETLKDKPAERERWLKIAESKIPEDDVGKYICRVVYNYRETKKRGTMTTLLRMTKTDLDKLREYLKK